MGKRRALFSVLFLSALALVMFSIYKLQMRHVGPDSVPPNQFLAAVVAILVPAVIAIGSMAFKPLRGPLEEWLSRDLDRDTCRIYLFGGRGSGKTSIIKNMFTADVLKPQSSTEYFDFYPRTVSYDLRGAIRFDVLVGDYKGESPAMVIVDLPETFAGPRDSREINVLFFVVDLVPRILDEGGHVVNDTLTLDWLKADPENKINSRVNEHLEYITAPMLQVVFAATYSPQLRSVRLVITKLDLIERAFRSGYLSPASSQDPKDWMRAHFARIEQDIRRACDANNIADFSVHVVSTTEDTGMRALMSDIWKVHLKATGVQIT